MAEVLPSSILPMSPTTEAFHDGMISGMDDALAFDPFADNEFDKLAPVAIEPEQNKPSAQSDSNATAQAPESNLGTCGIAESDCTTLMQQIDDIMGTTPPAIDDITSASMMDFSSGTGVCDQDSMDGAGYLPPMGQAQILLGQPQFVYPSPNDFRLGPISPYYYRLYKTTGPLTVNTGITAPHDYNFSAQVLSSNGLDVDSPELAVPGCNAPVAEMRRKDQKTSNRGDCTRIQGRLKAYNVCKRPNTQGGRAPISKYLARKNVEIPKDSDEKSPSDLPENVYYAAPLSSPRNLREALAMAEMRKQRLNAIKRSRTNGELHSKDAYREFVSPPKIQGRRRYHPGRRITVKQTPEVVERNRKRRERYRAKLDDESREAYDKDRPGLVSVLRADHANGDLGLH